MIESARNLDSTKRGRMKHTWKSHTRHCALNGKVADKKTDVRVWRQTWQVGRERLTMDALELLELDRLMAENTGLPGAGVTLTAGSLLHEELIRRARPAEAEAWKTAHALRRSDIDSVETSIPPIAAAVSAAAKPAVSCWRWQRNLDSVDGTGEGEVSMEERRQEAALAVPVAVHGEAASASTALPFWGLQAPNLDAQEAPRPAMCGAAAPVDLWLSISGSSRRPGTAGSVGQRTRSAVRARAEESVPESAGSPRWGSAAAPARGWPPSSLAAAENTLKQPGCARPSTAGSRGRPSSASFRGSYSSGRRPVRGSMRT